MDTFNAEEARLITEKSLSHTKDDNEHKLKQVAIDVVKDINELIKKHASYGNSYITYQWPTRSYGSRFDSERTSTIIKEMLIDNGFEIDFVDYGDFENISFDIGW